MKTLSPYIDAYPAVLLLCVALGAHGVRKGSLDVSGGVTAAILGWASLANPNWSFGVLLLVFYFSGSRATKVKADIKATLEREPASTAPSSHKAGHKSASGGQRNGWQVICNALAPSIASVIYRAYFSEEPFFRELVGFHSTSSTKQQIALRLFSTHATSAYPGSPLLFIGRLCVLFTLGHYAACMGDTLASELGILSKAPPRLITNLGRIVPPGTNGGVSSWGTLCSGLGGAFIGFTLFVSERLRTKGELRGVPSLTAGAKFIILGSAAGLAGSMLDSLLGATMQQTWFSGKTKQVLLGKRPQSDRRTEAEEEWEVISGRDILSNNTVNFVSSAFTGALTAIVGHYWI